MTHDEMIAVIAAHRDGKRIEFRDVRRGGEWTHTSIPVWDFDTFDYRIAEPKWRDATIDDMKRGCIPCRVTDDEAKRDWRDATLCGYCMDREFSPWVAVEECYDRSHWKFCQVEE